MPVTPPGKEKAMMYTKEMQLGKKKRKKHGKCIIPGDQKGKCYICGSTRNIHRHHVFYGTADRKLSEEYGLTVHLCVDCHELVHNKCKEADDSLKRIGQRAFEEHHGSRKEFMKIFGSNCLE